MKKALKLLAVAALAAVIGLSTAGCPPPGPDDGEAGSLGDTLTINAQVYTWDNNGFSPFTSTVPNLNYNGVTFLTELIDGTASVTLTDGKLNVTLGTPKDSALSSPETIMTIPEGVTVSPSGAKVFPISRFTTSADWNGGTVVQQRSANGSVTYVYCDKDVNVTGKFSSTYNGQTRTVDYALYLKAGWNSFFSTQTSVKTGKPADDYKWVVSSQN